MLEDGPSISGWSPGMGDRDCERGLGYSPRYGIGWFESALISAYQGCDLSFATSFVSKAATAFATPGASQHFGGTTRFAELIVLCHWSSSCTSFSTSCRRMSWRRRRSAERRSCCEEESCAARAGPPGRSSSGSKGSDSRRLKSRTRCCSVRRPAGSTAACTRDALRLRSTARALLGTCVSIFSSLSTCFETSMYVRCARTMELAELLSVSSCSCKRRLLALRATSFGWKEHSFTSCSSFSTVSRAFRCLYSDSRRF